MNQASPFGGVKASGHGRFGTRALNFLLILFTDVKQVEKKDFDLCVPPKQSYEIGFSLTFAQAYLDQSVCDRYDSSRLMMIDFPLPDQAVWRPFLRGLVRFAYSGGIFQKARGLWDLVSSLGRGDRVES